MAIPWHSVPIVGVIVKLTRCWKRVAVLNLMVSAVFGNSDTNRSDFFHCPHHYCVSAVRLTRERERERERESEGKRKRKRKCVREKKRQRE